MKIGLISDTHGWLDPAVHQWFAGVEMILHAGDVGKQEVLAELRTIAPTIAVRGNIDGRTLPLQEVVEVGGIRIGILHIAGSPKRARIEARRLIRLKHPDLLLFGHSHIPLIERYQGVLWVNPGAAGRQGFHDERTIMLLHLTDKQTIDFIKLGRRSK